MKITIIGQSSCIPDAGRETASLLVEGRHLIDTGWSAVLKMREYGFDPCAVESVLITHFHQDHYLGLASLLFYIGLRGVRRDESRPLTIAGPAEHLERIVEAAGEYLQLDRFPELCVAKRLIPLTPGDTFECGGLRVETGASRHVSGRDRREPAIAYRIRDPLTGAHFVYTGDTHPHPPLAEFAQGAPLLIHDGAHTPAREAAAVAKAAGVDRLVLIHCSGDRVEQVLREARDVFPDTSVAVEGRTLHV